MPIVRMWGAVVTTWVVLFLLAMGAVAFSDNFGLGLLGTTWHHGETTQLGRAFAGATLLEIPTRILICSTALLVVLQLGLELGARIGHYRLRWLATGLRVGAYGVLICGAAWASGLEFARSPELGGAAVDGRLPGVPFVDGAERAPMIALTALALAYAGMELGLLLGALFARVKKAQRTFANASATRAVPPQKGTTKRATA